MFGCLIDNKLSVLRCDKLCGWKWRLLGVAVGWMWTQEATSVPK